MGVLVGRMELWETGMIRLQGSEEEVGHRKLMRGDYAVARLFKFELVRGHYYGLVIFNKS